MPEPKWPRLENGLPDDQALDRIGIRGESYWFAPRVGIGSIEAPTTSYFNVVTGTSEQPRMTIWDGTEHHLLGEPLDE